MGTKKQDGNILKQNYPQEEEEEEKENKIQRQNLTLKQWNNAKQQTHIHHTDYVKYTPAFCYNYIRFYRVGDILTYNFI